MKHLSAKFQTCIPLFQLPTCFGVVKDFSLLHSSFTSENKIFLYHRMQVPHCVRNLSDPNIHTENKNNCKEQCLICLESTLKKI